MSQTCPIHGADRRPRWCKECAILSRERIQGKIELRPEDRGIIEEIAPGRYRVRPGKRLEAPSTGPWGRTWD